MSENSSSGDTPDRDPHDLSQSPAEASSSAAPADAAPGEPPDAATDPASLDPGGTAAAVERGDAEPPAPLPPEPPEFAAPTAEDPAPIAGDVAPAEGAETPAAAPDAEAPAGPPLPASFDELPLPDPLRRAIARLGWPKPTPVQALSYDPLVAGRDVIVQSHTGSGKTGAFCIPWLASRFDPQPATQTGVQLLVLLPTRELAKQVCDELRRLAIESPVDVLPVYGGTPMQPQLSALRAGVHAVVGTPGRILDHIRRRSLDLSKVTTVVLDECDEMLSMGFLEDIRAILDQITAKHQTALFSATIPSDVERIARRYMHEPVPIQLSGDQVAAAEIDHAYYLVNSAIKTRDLLDVIMVEDPARAIVFCNTREETKLVASVLRREGWHAEELSSDLNQTQRERVMKAMREHKIRFLVATDVAARGIDISHVTHVINYSFPESAEVYVHRTGRTGRAGRTGVALSLISPREIGNFYYLKLQYGSIKFSERQLPPAEELAAERTEFKLDGISKRFPELVSPEWVLLARSLMADPRGERVIALLLERAMRQAPRPEPILEPTPEAGEAPLEADAAAPAPPGGPGEVIEREQRDLREPREAREFREGREGRGEFGGRRDRGDRRDRERGRFRDRFRDEPRDAAGEPGEFRRDGDGRGESRHDGEPRGESRRDGEPRGESRRDGEPRGESRRDGEPRGEFRRDGEPRGEFRRDEARRDGEPRRDGEFRRDRRDRRDRRELRDGERRDAREDGERRDASNGERRDAPNGERRDAPNGERRDAPNGERRDAPRRDRPEHEGRGRWRDRPRRRDEPRPTSEAAPPSPAPTESPAELAPAPAPEDVLATAPAPVAVAVDSEHPSLPAPGRLPLDRRGRLGDRGRFMQHLVAAAAATVAPPAVDTVTAAAGETPAAAPTSTDAAGEFGEGRRKRRRKRRRGRRDGDAPVDGAAPTDVADDSDDADDDEPIAEAAAPVEAAAPAVDADGGEGRRRRRRRRRGARDGAESRPVEAEAPAAPQGVPVEPARRLTQDEIIIDIDENELAVVQDEFGEIEDEFDEFALMDRRQAVIETLQEEVELEDVSRGDAGRLDVADADDGGDEEDDESEPADAEASPEAAPAAGEAADAESSDADADASDDARKKRRRRRRKKPAPLVMPELTAPPHKDFWEVWASKYTFQDFEDGKFVSPNPVPEVEEEPPPPEKPARPAAPPPRASAPRPAPPRPAPSRAAVPAAAEADDAEFAKVCLNLGRTHGHKAATIRALLRDHLALEGRAIRDLTVRDADTLFRVHHGEVERIQGALASVREGDVQLAIAPVLDDQVHDLRAPLPEDLALPAVESLALDAAAPAADEAPAPALADDAGTT
jgi:ATP-dependent RNA helicase DeaD